MKCFTYFLSYAEGCIWKILKDKLNYYRRYRARLSYLIGIYNITAETVLNEMEF
jgi:hypothetical protein